MNVQNSASKPFYTWDALSQAENNLRFQNAKLSQKNKELSSLKDRVTELSHKIKAYTETPCEARGSHVLGGLGYIVAAAAIAGATILYFKMLFWINPNVKFTFDSMALLLAGMMGTLKISAALGVGALLLASGNSFYEACKSIKTLEKAKHGLQEEIKTFTLAMTAEENKVRNIQDKIEEIRKNYRCQLEEMYGQIDQAKTHPDVLSSQLQIKIYTEKALELSSILNARLGPLTCMTEAQWKQLEPYVPELTASPTIKTPAKRQLLDTLIYSWKAGNRELPVGPQWVSQATLYEYMRKWSDDGSLKRLQQAAQRISLITT